MTCEGLTTFSFRWATLVASSLAFLLLIYSKRFSRRKMVFSKARKRELSVSELFFHNAYIKAKSLVSFVTVFESKVNMQDSEVKWALETLSRQHPFLRMTIEGIKDGEETRFFYKEMEHFAIDLRTCDLEAKTESDWQLAFSHELLQPMDCEGGPLWRICQLKESLNPNGTIMNCLVWTFHHSIIDGHSVGMIIDEFLVLLHKQYNSDIDDIAVEERYDLLPSCETFIEDQLRLCCIGRLKLGFNVRLRAWNVPYTQERVELVQNFFAKFPRKEAKHRETTATVCETRAVFVTLDAAETQQLVLACRRRGCTVSGLLTAASSMAIAELMEDGEIMNDWVIPSTCLVNMRKHCKNINTGSDIGLFIGAIPVRCTVSALMYSSASRALWRIAQECTVYIRSKLASKCHINDFKILHNISSPSVICRFYQADVLQNFAGRYRGEYFSLSNMGVYTSSVINGSRPTYRISGMFFGCGEHINGPLFANNFVTVNGKLCFTALYFTTVTETNIADEYRSRILAKLHLAIQKR